MALTYRSPIEEVLTSYTTVEQSEIASTSLKTYKEIEIANHSRFNFHLSPMAKQRFFQAGIYLSPFSALPHSHPCCKTLENYLLFRVLPSYLDSTFFFVGIKDCKIKALKAMNKKLELCELINRYVTSADLWRYPTDTFVVNGGAPACSTSSLRNLFGIGDGDSTKELIPKVLRVNRRNVFLHDELHYWTPGELCGFLDATNINKMLATVVIPPELLIGAKSSMNKWCYEFECVGDTLRFYPDGVASEGYEQPLNCSYLLKTKKLITRSGSIYSVDLLCSKFSHHLLAFTRGDLKVKTHHVFSDFEAVSANFLKPILGHETSCFPISYTILSKIYRYLCTLSKPDVMSAVAKLGQIVPEPTAFELKFTMEFAKLVIKVGTKNSLILPDLWEDFKVFALNFLPAVISTQFSCFVKSTLDDFVSNLCPLRFDVSLETIDCRNLLIDAVDAGLALAEKLLPEDVPIPVVDLSEPPVLLEDRESAYYSNMHTSESWEVMDVEGIVDRLALLFSNIFTFDELIILDLEGLERYAFQRFGHKFVNDLLLTQDHYRFWDLVFLKSAKHGKIRLTALASGTGYFLMGPQSGDSQSSPITPCVTVHATPIEEVEMESEESIALRICEPLNCACGLAIPCTEALSIGFDHISFKDSLHGRDAAYFSKDGSGYSYSGGAHESQGWLAELDDLLIVHGEEVDYYDCVLVQRYRAKGAIGFHADNEPIFHPGGKICTFQFYGDCVFSFKCAAGIFHNELKGSCKFTMPEGFQDSHKHKVSDCSEGRISFTFRKLRQHLPAQIVSTLPIEENREPEISDRVSIPSDDDSAALTIFDVEITSVDLNPENMVPIEVPGDGTCFWHSLGYFMGLDGHELKKISSLRFKNELGLTEDDFPNGQLEGNNFAELETICACSKLFGVEFLVCNLEGFESMRFDPPGQHTLCVLLGFGNLHYRPMVPKNDCVPRAIAEALGRSLKEVFGVLSRSEYRHLYALLGQSGGVEIEDMENFFELFDIHAFVELEGKCYSLNPKGSLEKCFKLVDGHLTLEIKPRDEIFRVKKVDALKQSVREIPVDCAMKLRLSGTTLHYSWDPNRANVLLGSLHKARTGILSSELFNGVKLRQIPACNEKSTREVCTILGTFGAGKSSLLSRLFTKIKGCAIHFVSPRKGLADDMRDLMAHSLGSLDPKHLKKQMSKANWEVSTFELFLLRIDRVRSGTAVFLDEIQLFPPGYLDIVCSLLPMKCSLFLIGDPCQSDYDSEKDRAVFGDLGSDVDRLLLGKEYKYVVSSRRFSNQRFEGRLPCDFSSGSFKFDEPFEHQNGLNGAVDINFKYREVVLVSSFVEKHVIHAIYGEAQKVLTFGESTGRTFDYGTILISESSLLTSEKRWVTALSRFRKNICFLNALEANFEEIAKRFSGRFLGKFLVKQASTDDIKNILPGSPKFVSDFAQPIGKGAGVFEEKLMGDPWLKSELFLGQDEDVADEHMAEFVEQQSWFKTHLPKCERETLRARWVHRIMAKEDREFHFKDLRTEQFADDHGKNRGVKLTNAAERFESIYPRHKASDTLTFLMAVKKRLRFSKPAVECAKIKQADMYGDFLLKEFLKKVPLPNRGRPDLMAEAVRDFELKKISKSSATIQNHAGRSCKDWLIDMGLVFSKSQLCTKWGNRFIRAKAAQTIVCFQHAVLCRFAPYMRYIEKILSTVLPSNFYIHSGKSLEELNEWVKIAKFEGICTESDYEAFDASQDHYIMAFEVSLMKHLGLPVDLIEDYKFIKTHLGCKLGNFAIMRFSGEASTFLFNTMANMLFTFLRYDLNGTEFICFAGDDMCASKRLRVSNKFEDFLSKLKLKAKVDFVASPTFCGWNLVNFGIYKLPQLVFERMCIAKERNVLADCIDNYAIEVSYAYKLGELATNHMNEEEMEAFYNCVRVIIKNMHIMKSDVAEVFRNNTS